MRRETISTGPEQKIQRAGIIWERPAGPVEFHMLLGRALTIGRQASSTIVIDAANVATSHAVIQFSSGQYLLENLDEVNPTRVNGQPVAQCLLTLGDVIEIGSERLRFADLAARPAGQAGGVGKIVRLAAVGLGTAVFLVVVLRMMVPTEPGPAAPQAAAPAATPAAPAATPSTAPEAAPRPVTPGASTTDTRAEPPIVRQIVDEAKQAGVSEADALFDEGTAQLRAGRLRDASQLFAAVLARQPDRVAAANRLREVQQKLEASLSDAMTRAERARALLRYSEAIALWESVLELAPPSDPRREKARLGIEESRRHLGR